jgi:chromosome condensin MukBEF ATPase and DNA-binding subunit MukB
VQSISVAFGALALHTWPVPVLVPLALLSVASATRSFVHCAEPLQERLNSKLDELAEVEETRDVYKKQKDKALEQLSQLQELLQKQSESQQVANELLKSVEQNVKAKGARAQQRAAVTLSPGAEDAYEDDFEED